MYTAERDRGIDEKAPMTRDDIMDEPLKRVSPFAERLGKDEYFTGAGHLNILVNIRKDIAARVPMMVLTGAEGCGKSVLGKMVASEARPGCILVYFDSTVDSFEEVVAAIAEKIDVETPEFTRESIAAALEQIAAGLAQRGERLLLICDGAERIYLATLERLRKMLDRLNRVVVSMQVVLIGRPLLLNNLRQLSLCNFEEVEEKHYILEPLNASETRSYLEFCRKKMSEAEGSIFVPELADRIYQGSGGNFKKFHHLAEQLCNRYNKDASFWVLLENVESGATTSRLGVKLRRLWLLLSPLWFSRRRRMIGSGVAVLGLLLFLFFAGGKERPESDNQAAGNGPAGIRQGQPGGATGTSPDPTLNTNPPSGGKEQGVQPVVVESPGPQETEPRVAAHQEVTKAPPKVEQAEDAPSPPPAATVTEDAEVTEDGTADPTAVSEKPRTEDEVLVAEALEAVEIARQHAGRTAAVAEENADPSQEQIPPSAASIPAAREGAENLQSAPLADGMHQTDDSAAEIPMLQAVRMKKIERPEGMNAAPQSENDGPAAPQSLEASTRQTEVVHIRQVKAKRKILTGHAATEGVNVDTTRSPEVNRQRQSPSVAAGARAIRGLQAQVPVTGGGRVPIAAESKKIPVLSQAIVPDKMLTASNSERGTGAAADAPWLAGKRDNKYTVQLMVLSSGAAEENTRKILARKEYNVGAGRLHVFEKKSGPPSVFVFFGEYATLAEAQAARDSLPDVLQKHKPYVLSVHEAIEKTK